MELMNITIWLTTACNLKCTYCYEKDKEKIYLTNDRALKTIDYITNYLYKNNLKQCNIHFHGGEPLLNEDVLWIIIEELNKNTLFNYKFSITTNGTILTETFRHNLMKIDNISVSIDGLKFVNDKYRKTIDGKSCYNVVISNAMQLLRERSDITIRITVTPDTVKFLYENIVYLINLGFYRINHAIDYWSNDWTSEKFVEYDKQIRMIRNYIHSTASLKVSIDGIDKMKFVKKSKCTGGIYSLNIYADGKIYPCTCVSGDDCLAIGNIEDGIRETWFSELNEINNIEMEICKDCTLIEYCVSNKCKFFNKVFTGSYNMPCTNVCAMQNIKYQLSKD